MKIIPSIIISAITLNFILWFLILLSSKSVDTEPLMYHTNMTTTNNTLSNMPGPCGKDPTNLSCKPPACFIDPSQPECILEEGTPNISEIKKLFERLNSEKP